MQITSPAFVNGDVIPQKYGRDFANVNPPLSFSDMPEGTVSLALIMDDPDVPPVAGVPVWDHWVVFNMAPDTNEIAEGIQPEGVRGKGTRGELDYGGPRPPDREHRYYFRVYALNVMLDLPEGSSKKDVLHAAEGHILATAEIMGRFSPIKR